MISPNVVLVDANEYWYMAAIASIAVSVSVLYVGYWIYGYLTDTTRGDDSGFY